MYRVPVMSGIFGKTVKFGQRPCLYWNKNKLTKQTVKAVSSGFTLFANVCPNFP